LSALEKNHCLLPLPPFSVPGPAYLSGDPAALRLELWGAAAAGISPSLDVDCLHLLPGGSFVQLEGAGGTAAGDMLVWDGCHAQVYSLNAAGEQDFSTHLLAGGSCICCLTRPTGCICSSRGWTAQPPGWMSGGAGLQRGKAAQLMNPASFAFQWTTREGTPCVLPLDCAPSA
jgi:hypothetical protein